MNIRNFTRAIFAIACVFLALVAFGCGGNKDAIRLIPNERPRVSLTAAPVNTADTAYYAYKISWSGFDPDGRVSYFLYAIDPKGGENPETTWVRTTKNEETIFFRASIPDTNSGPTYQANEYHVFVIKAIDDDDDQSVPQSRAFISYTMAPIVNIVNPRPSHLGEKQVTPSVRITWEGRDDDGVFTQKPVKYKYRLLGPGDAEYPSDRAIRDPNSARRYFASTNFAGWDSTSAETTFAQYTGLTPSTVGGVYLFIVVGFDEAGAYSADWSLDNNMLAMTVGYAGTLGPRLGFFNEFFNYFYPSGGYAPNDELSWVRLEIPADIPLTVNWFAQPPEGAAIEWYRWKLDGDVTDETPRTNEATDWYHWSQKSVGTTQCTIGPFPANPSLPVGPPHYLYVEAMDNTGIKSIGTIELSPKRPTFEKELLVVDDMRSELDYNNANGTKKNYTTAWPAAAELDTFLYAVGGYNWRRTPRPGTSTPGILSGYSFDTLGTRQGYEIATYGAPLSVLGKYRHIIWLVDQFAATRLASPTDIVNGITTLRYMSAPGKASTLAAYIYAGGKVWMAGGAVGYATLLDYNAVGVRGNDNIYGIGNTVFSNSSGELVGGRIMFDYVKWQSEMVTSVVNTQVTRSSRAVGGWTHPGVNYVGTVTAPDYSVLPPTLRRRSAALGDTLPPTRTATQGSSYFTSGAIPVEFLTQPNVYVEDANPDPVLTREISTLDTLYELVGGSLATNITGQRAASMTYYHGMTSQPLVFSGFSFWDWTKADCISLVDFVLQRIWGLSRAPINRMAQPAVRRPATPMVVEGQKTSTARLPIGRTRE
ncbi:MAG: hypothetical protein U0704_04010 [Candidatus Eisenbacteria bacterium]